jgi:hypothetical protein
MADETMGKRVLVAVTVIVLIALTAIAGITYWSTMNSPLQEQTEFRNEYGDVTLDAPTYNFSPPVSMYHALNTALSKNWDATSLQNKTIHISLDYSRFYDNENHRGFELLNTVTQPVSDCSAVTISNGTETSTYRYFWHLSITETFEKVPGCPNPNYWIDASTAEEIHPPGPQW